MSSLEFIFILFGLLILTSLYGVVFQSSWTWWIKALSVISAFILFSGLFLITVFWQGYPSKMEQIPIGSIIISVYRIPIKGSNEYSELAIWLVTKENPIPKAIKIPYDENLMKQIIGLQRRKTVGQQIERTKDSFKLNILEEIPKE